MKQIYIDEIDCGNIDITYALSSAKEGSMPIILGSLVLPETLYNQYYFGNKLHTIKVQEEDSTVYLFDCQLVRMQEGGGLVGLSFLSSHSSVGAACFTGADKMYYLDNTRLGNVEEIMYDEYIYPKSISGYIILSQYLNDPTEIFKGKHNLTMIQKNKQGFATTESILGLELTSISRGHTFNDIGTSIKAYFKAESIIPLHPVKESSILDKEALIL